MEPHVLPRRPALLPFLNKKPGGAKGTLNTPDVICRVDCKNMDAVQGARVGAAVVMVVVVYAGTEPVLPSCLLLDAQAAEVNNKTAVNATSNSFFISHTP